MCLEISVEASQTAVSAFHSTLYYCTVGVVEHIAGFADAIHIDVRIERYPHTVSEIS